MKAQTAAPTLIAKLSVKGIGCVPVGRSTPTSLCVILGRASGIKTGVQKDKSGEITGEWSALTGSFQAKNLETGEVFRSGKLFLPSGIHEVVESKVKELGETGGVVEFALEIRSIESSSPAGYKYQAVPLIEPAANQDELAHLIAAIETQVPLQIAAPAETPAVAMSTKKK
jgi:hypothetical protein